MNSPERTLRPDDARLFKVKAARGSLTERHGPPAGHAPVRLNGFSIARIYSTFQLKRAEIFPEELGDGAFEILVDLFQYEWLNRRIRAPMDGGMRFKAETALPIGIAELAAAQLVTVTQSEEGDTAAIIRLSPMGRARLNLFFGAMEDYISMI